MVEPMWQRVAAIFDAVVDLPPQQREAALERLCEGDAELRAELWVLLRADDDAESFDRALDATRSRVAAEWVETVEKPARVAERIGPWRVERELGRGGMGVVFLVERADGQFEQRAALKLIKRGMESETVLARFLRERQLLARLAHPNIASLLDGGLSADGRPYFVMEYVEGRTLPAYCAERLLDLRARIELIRQVCAAVQFAHRRLVVHRDIKPANVLVAGNGQVKLLDFGIAKLLDDETGEGVTQTLDGRGRVLTPAYAAPEQMRGEAVTTATDVYSLGCLLYEVLTGVPRHVDAAHAMRRENADPPLASAALAAQENPAIAARQVRGDLDTIVATALQAEPERRYATVAALSDDLRRYLDGQPIAAQRDSVVYHARKFVARHRAGVALFALAVASLVAMTAFALRAAWRADEEARRTAAISGFLIDIFRVADPKDVPGGLKMSALDVLDAGAQRLDAQLAAQPQLALRFAQVLGTIYIELGQYDRAIDLLRQALDNPGDGDDPRTRADALAELARAQYEKGAYADAETNAQNALRLHRRVAGERSALVAPDLALQGEIARRQGDFPRAEPLLRDALAISRATLTPPHAQIAGELNQYAALKSDMRQIDEGAALTEEALAMFRRLYGDNHLDVAENLANLGVFRMQTDRVAEAPALLDRATAIYRRLLPADHPHIAELLNNHARALDRLGRYGEAEPLYQEALAMLLRLLGDQHPDVAATLNNLALLRAHQGDYAASADFSRRALAVWAALGKPEHPFAVGSKANLAVALRESGDLAAADALFRDVLASRRAQPGANALLVSFSLDQIGVTARLAGRTAQALAAHREAQAIRTDLSGLPAAETASMRAQYAMALADAGDLVGARAQIDQALDALRNLHPANDEQFAGASIVQARIAIAQGDGETGCAAADAALRQRPLDDGVGGWRHAEAIAVRGECLVARGRIAEGRADQQSALAALERLRGPDHWMTREVRRRLAAHAANA